MARGGSKRGLHLFADGLRWRSAGPLAARLVAGRLEKLVAKIGSRITVGSLKVTYPDGGSDRFVGTSSGPDGAVVLHDWRALARLATGGSVGWYQAWEKGEWTSPDPVQLFAVFSANGPSLGNIGRASGPWRWLGRLFHRLHRNSRRGAEANIRAHYDLGNDFYAAWLDPTMTYSSAYFRGGASELREGQEAKVAAIAKRLRIEPRAEVLEIGCGWGYLSRRLAADYGAEVTGISLSDEQLAWARQRAQDEGIHGVTFRHCDYRDIGGQFDGIVSVEMVEALGREYWPAFMDAVARCLKPGGRAAIQFIAMQPEVFAGYARNADFIQTYVFPGGLLIEANEFKALAEARGLDWTEQEDFGEDYALTLELWRAAFDAACADGRLPADFDDRFRKLWRFYLMYCEGGFRGGSITVSQVTLVKRG